MNFLAEKILLKEPIMKNAIGIDLGTAVSKVSIYKAGKVEVIHTLSSIVSFNGANLVVGEMAENQSHYNTVFEAKRLLGQLVTTESVKQDMKLWPAEVRSGNGDRPKIFVFQEGRKTSYCPEEIVAMILRELKHQAELSLKSKVNNAVLTVPIHFTDSQRQAIKDAASIAGLRVLHLLNEPTAAAVAAYALDKEGKLTYAEKAFEENKVLVLSIGASSIQSSILNIGYNVFQVVSSASEKRFGGRSVDKALFDWFVSRKFPNNDQFVVRKNPDVVLRLLEECERAKCKISTSGGHARITLHWNNANYEENISMHKLEQMCQPIVDVATYTMQNALDCAKLDKKDIDQIILAGSSTKLPEIRKLLVEMFGSAKIVDEIIDSDQLVVCGAGVLGSHVSHIGEIICDENECIQDLLTIDATAYRIGIKTDNFDSTSPQPTTVIAQNTIIPTSGTKEFSPAHNSSEILFKLYEHDHMWKMKTEPFNVLGEYAISAESNRVYQIKLTLSIDYCGILEILADDLLKGERLTIIRKDKTRLSPEEVKKMALQDLPGVTKTPSLPSINRNEWKCVVKEIPRTVKQAPSMGKIARPITTTTVVPFAQRSARDLWRMVNGLSPSAERPTFGVSPRENFPKERRELQELIAQNKPEHVEFARKLEIRIRRYFESAVAFTVDERLQFPITRALVEYKMLPRDQLDRANKVPYVNLSTGHTILSTYFQQLRKYWRDWNEHKKEVDRNEMEIMLREFIISILDIQFVQTDLMEQEVLAVLNDCLVAAMPGQINEGATAETVPRSFEKKVAPYIQMMSIILLGAYHLEADPINVRLYVDCLNHEGIHLLTDLIQGPNYEKDDCHGALWSALVAYANAYTGQYMQRSGSRSEWDSKSKLDDLRQNVLSAAKCKGSKITVKDLEAQAVPKLDPQRNIFIADVRNKLRINKEVAAGYFP